MAMAQSFIDFDKRKASLESTTATCTCSYCKNLFVDPKLLPCLHSFCKKCLVELTKKFNTTTVIVCEICGENTPMPSKGIEAITPNIHLDHESKISKFEKLMKKETPPPCDECSRESTLDVISFCCTCESFLCKECHSQHILSRKLTLHHKTILLKDSNNIKAQLKENIGFPPIQCKIHSNDEIKLYCVSCKTLICIQCALTKHGGHQLEDLITFVNQEKVNIREVARELPEHVSKLENLIRSAKAVMDSIKVREKSIGSDIKKVFGELHRKLDDRENTLLKQCSTISRAKMSTLAAQMEHLYSLRMAIATSTQQVNQSANSYNTAEFVSVASTLHSRIDTIKGKILHTRMELTEDDVINFTADISGLLNTFSVVGSVLACRPRDFTSLRDPALIIKASNPYHVAIHRNGSLVVANHTGDSVEVYNVEGRNVHTFGSSGKEKGQFQQPLGVTLAGDMIYVVEFTGGRCQKFSINGDFICEFGSGQLKNAWGCAVDKNGVVYIAEEGNHRVQSFSPEGSELKVLCNAPLICSPRDVTIDKTGRIHVACLGSKCVKVFDASGSFLVSYGNGQLTEPSGVAVDSLGYCFVADWGGCSLQIFDPMGRHIHRVKYDGNHISGVAVDDNNHVYVVNHSKQTIYKY